MNKTYYYKKIVIVTGDEQTITLPKLNSIEIKNIGTDACQYDFDNNIDDTYSLFLSAKDGGYDSEKFNFSPVSIHLNTIAGTEASCETMCFKKTEEECNLCPLCEWDLTKMVCRGSLVEATEELCNLCGGIWHPAATYSTTVVITGVKARKN